MPEMLFAHANDDGVTPLSSAVLYAALKKNEVPAELHISASERTASACGRTRTPSPRAGSLRLKTRGYLDKKSSRQEREIGVEGTAPVG